MKGVEVFKAGWRMLRRYFDRQLDTCSDFSIVNL